MAQNFLVAGPAPRIVISSEADAWELLGELLAGRDVDDRSVIKFEGWPNYDFKVNGRDWHSSVPTRIMGPLLELQKEINRTYASIVYNEPKPGKLKDDDRDRLELVVTVKDGSSEFFVKLAEQFTEIVKNRVNHMTTKELLTLALIAALAYSSTTMFSDWVDGRTAVAEQEAQVEKSAQETERLRIFAEALNRQPQAVEFRESATLTQSRVLKAMKPEDKISTRGVELKGTEARSIAQPDNEIAEDIELSGVYRIQGNRIDSGKGFKLRLESQDGEQVITAFVSLALPDDQQQLLKDAEWTPTGGLIYPTIHAQKFRGAIRNAEVVSVRAVQPGDR